MNILSMKQFARTVTEALLTDVEKHLPPATEPQFIPPLKPDVIVPQYDVTSTDPHTQHPPPVTTQPRIVGPPQETSLLESNADGIFFLSICLFVICMLSVWIATHCSVSSLPFTRQQR